MRAFGEYQLFPQQAFRAGSSKGTIVATPRDPIPRINMELCLSRGPCRTLVCEMADTLQVDIAKWETYGDLNDP